MKFVLLINLKLLTIANSSLLNIADHENFSANNYEKMPAIVFIAVISRENFMLSCVRIFQINTTMVHSCMLIPDDEFKIFQNNKRPFIISLQ